MEVARTAHVDPERLYGWVARFEARHGAIAPTASDDALVLTAADGATARLINRWEPFVGTGVAEFTEHVLRDRRVGFLLVRKGADAVGVAQGTDLVAHRTSVHYVQGRTKAGGWSQQRYARRRGNQATRAYDEAARDAFEVVVPHRAGLDALVTGGDRAGVDTVLADPRLEGLRGLPRRHPVLPVPDARLAVLYECVRQARRVPVELDAAAVAVPSDGEA